MASQRKPKEYIQVGLKGMAMGAADIVPGVSGGTIAFITGIYDELLNSLKSLNPMALLVLKEKGLKAAWHHVNGNFLCALFAGVLISIKTFASVFTYLLAHYPLLVWGFFSGLILASAISMYKKEETWPLYSLFPFFMGVGVVVLIALAALPQIEATPLTMFLGGFVAITAMILPGVSGSFILLLVGLYPAALEAITTHNYPILLSFLLGCIMGLMVFSRFLSFFLERFRVPALATLLGFLVGSLFVTWPWKIPVKTMLDRHGEEVVLASKNVLPSAYEATFGNEAQFFMVLLCALIGIFLVLFSELLGVKYKKNN